MRFPMNLRWTAYIAHKHLPKRRFKNAKRPFSFSNCTSLEKVWHKVSLCEYCQRQSFKAFTAGLGLTIRAKMVRGGRPLYVNIWPNLTHPLQKRRYQPFARSAPALTPTIAKNSSVNTK